LRRGRPRLKDTSAIAPSETSFPSTLSVEPFLILLALGFAIGGLGHLFGVRFLVGVGIMLVLVARLVGPIVVVLLMR
jgi:hypothetical protein